MATLSEALAAAFELHQSGRLAEADALYARVLEADPGNATALHLRGLAATQASDAPRAVDLLRAAADAAPDHALIRSNLGAALRQAGRLAEAEEALRAALALDPGRADAAANLGAVLHALGRHQAARACLEGALALDPDAVPALINLGVVLTDMGEAARAADMLGRAVALAPGNAEAEWNLAVALLTAGRWREGWPAFESRLRRPGVSPERLRAPRWDGSDPRGLTILVHAEQGRGDTIQFARYVPHLAARGAHIILACQPELARLLATVPGVAGIVPFGSVPPLHDAHCPVMSLPFALELDGPPAAPMPYLSADPAAVAAWRGRLPAGARVGLAWAGAPGNSVDGRRSLDPALLAPLAAIEGVTWVSLQKAPRALPPLPGLVDATAELGDFADTAALVATLDLVVSVDTATAHLAGALGRPVWLLNRWDGCWRWGKGRLDSPWYPRLRQFRQGVPGDWGPAVAALATALKSWREAR
ncbi:MAG TPA: tetratricopeptide repeat protein [Azospirillaceae bacterium]|nr:tetratricopeptide repeat protein [Azospirillaceae bacterium]